MKLMPWLLVIVLLVGCSGTPTPLPDSMVVTEPILMELVRVPAGEFLMGSDSMSGEKPQHRVTLDDFYIGKYEVTNAQYAAFVKATGRAAPGGWENGNVPAGKEDHPVVDVSWNDAAAFKQWLGRETGMAFRLCTEAEWEKACGGTDGRLYSWDATLGRIAANIGGRGTTPGETTPVGRYSPEGDSPYGVADMSGNVWEWVADRYGEDYYAGSPSENPQGPTSGDTRVTRGGSFVANLSYARCSKRFYTFEVNRKPDLGFRVCMSPGP